MVKRDKPVVGMVAACPFPSSQGSQVLIRQMARALSLRGHSVHIIAYPYGDIPPDSDYTLHRAHSLFSHKKLDPGPSLIKPLLDLMLLLKVVSVVGQEKISILHGHNYEGVMVAWAAGRWLGIPVVYHCHTLLADELPTYMPGPLTRSVSRFFGSLIDGITSRIPDHIFAVSEDIVAKMSRVRGDAKGVTYLPPGIVPEEWKDLSAPERNTSEERRIVYAGNLADFQNIPHLLEAVQLVRATFPTIKLQVITPSNTDKLLELARSLGVEDNLSIVIEKEFKNIAPLLVEADLACSARTIPSGFPIKNLNYMAAGLPTVCYRNGAKGIVDGETGLVVEDNDVRALSDAIINLLKHTELRHRMGKKASKVAFRDYSWDDLAAKMEEIHLAL